MSGSEGLPNPPHGQRDSSEPIEWTWRNVALLSVVTSVPAWVCFRSLFERGWKAEAADVSLLVMAGVLACLPMLLPIVEEWPGGLKFRTLADEARRYRNVAKAAAERAVEEIEMVRRQAQTARRMAQLYHALNATLMGRWGTGYRNVQAFGRVLARLSREPEGLPIREVARRLGIKSLETTGEILECLEDAGIVAIGKEEGRPVRLVEEFGDAVREAFGGHDEGDEGSTDDDESAEG